MKKILFPLLSIIAINSYAQNATDVPHTATDVARREAKLKSIAEEKTKNQQANNEQPGNGVAQLEKKFFQRNNAKITTGNCSSFVQSLGGISSYDQRVLVIDTPGYYFFAENIKWNPNHCPNPAAIIIVADDVVLDLKGYTLSANYADTNRQFTGISIVASNNVTIKNGTISGMTYYGVSAEASANITVDNITVNNMKYYNVNKADTSLTPCGIILSGVNTFTVKNSKVHHINTTSSSCAGIQAVASRNGILLNDTISDLKNYDGSVQGFSYILSDSINTIRSHSSNFQSYYQGLTSTLGHTVLGFMPTLCHYLNYDSCSATNMTGCCDDCHGISIFLDSVVTINNFSAKHIVDGIPPYNTGAKATGLEVYGYDVTVTNSTVDSIIAIVPQDLQSTGFSAWGKNITFNNCTAKNVVVLNARQISDTTKGYGTGFGWAPDPRTEFDTVTANAIIYSNCKAVNCQLGFDTWYHTNSTWRNDSVQNCALSILIQPQTAQRTLFMNKCSESPNGMPQSTLLVNKAKDNNIQPINIGK